MSKTMRFAMRVRWVTVVAAVLLLIPIALTACGGTDAPPTEPPVATEVAAATAVPTEEPTEPPTLTPTEPPPTDTPQPTDTATPEPTDTPTPEPADDSGCVTCHTNEEGLQALAEEPEETETLSEGEG